MTSRFLLALAASLTVILCSFTQARAVDSDSTLRLYLPSDPHTLLPLLGTTHEESDVARLMFDPLFDYDSDNALVPILASSIPARSNGGISADGLSITIHLRQNVRWHDGVPFTSADVVYTIHAVLDDHNNVSNRELYKEIADVDAVDAYTVRFHLKEPQSSFFANIGAGYPIVPSHLLQGSAHMATDGFNAMPVGTGPYRFVRWDRGDHLELTANGTYFLGSPKIVHIVISRVRKKARGAGRFYGVFRLS